MEFTTVLKTPKDSLNLIDRTIEWDFSGFPNWHPEGAYGYELDILNNEFRSRSVSDWLPAWLRSNHFERIGYPHSLYTTDKWISFETRNSGVDLKNILTYLNTFVIKYHIGDTGILIGRVGRTLWVEERQSLGIWESLEEMFKY